MNITFFMKLLVKSPRKFVEKIIQYPPVGMFISDKAAISILYRLRFHKRINLCNPQTFNEKLLWLTLYDRKPEYIQMVDKYEAKNWITQKLLERGMPVTGIIPTYGIYDKFDDIDFDKLPQSFVMKTTHDSGGVVVVQNKKDFDKEASRAKLESSLRRNYFWFSREWAYKDVTPRIIIEKKLETDEPVPKDWKIFCLNGKAKFWFIAHDRMGDIKFDYYDMDWNKLPVVQGHPNSDIVPEKPECWDNMVECAELLSKGIPCLRVDFYVDKYGQFYIGELTLTHFSALVPFEPEEWDYKFGSMLELPKINKNVQ